MSLKSLTFDNKWTLFLDRDGVVNRRLPGMYIKIWDEFEFLPGVTDAFRKFAEIFGRVVVVTNQQGIGKGLMTEKQLLQVHDEMRKEILQTGGKLDAIYHSPYLEVENHPSRKPDIGMAIAAKKDFPEIDFERSVMVGDSIKDMQFGKKLNMYCAFVHSNLEEFPGKGLVDSYWNSLFEFARSIKIS